MSDKSTPIPGYKGFDKDLKCRDMQYALNSEFTESEVKICEKGLHFCENPLDVFAYYPPADSRYAAVVGSGESDREDKSDTKVAVTHLKIGDEISLHTLIESGVKYIIDRTTPSGAASNSGDRGAASNSGDRGAASNSGDRGAASNSGYRGAASNSGDSGVASNSGDSGAASNSGYSGAASNSGYRGAASNSGYRGAASNSGDSGAASNSGDRGVASNSGYRGAASNSGYSGAASNSGYRGAASNSGDRGAASNSGDRGAASNSGDRGAAFTNAIYSIAETDAPQSIAVAVGYKDKARGSIGSWLVLAERNDEYEIVDVKAVHVDGEKVKAGVFYILTGGKLTEA